MFHIHAVLLDIDGTLIDSNDAHASAWVKVASEYGYVAEFSDVRRMIGMGGDRVLPSLTGLAEDSDRGAEILQRRGRIFREEYLPTLRAFPGARGLLERLSGDGYTLVTASSASGKDLQALLRQAGVEDLMDGKTSSDDAAMSKPAPDIVHAALRRAGCRAGEAVMIGDTPYDVKASLQAGVRCIGFGCGGWTDEDLVGASEIYESPADMLERYAGSLVSRGSGTKRH